jgi:hypothetical protein
MTTPVSGQISFSSLRSQIMQSGSGQVRLRADAGNRLGYGAATNVKMSDLYICWGATIASDGWQDKFSNQFYGVLYDVLSGLPNVGSIDNTQPMPGMNVNSVYTNVDGNSATLELYFSGGASGPYLEYPTANISRLCTANALRTLTATSSSGSFQYANWSNGTPFPDNLGTVAFGLKWIPYTGGGGGDPGGGGGFNCCFSGDTEVTMSDHSIKLINTIEVGDQILSYNHDTEQHETNEVSEVVTRVNQKMYEFHLANGTKIKGSHDHPFYVIGKGYCSMNPELTMIGYKDFTNVSEIQVGDSFIDKNGSGIIVEQILPIEFYDTVYTFKNKIRTSPNYYANGVLVY